MTFELIQAMGRTGPDLERLVVDFFANEASVVTINVPGPKTARYVVEPGSQPCPDGRSARYLRQIRVVAGCTLRGTS